MTNYAEAASQALKRRHGLTILAFLGSALLLFITGCESTYYSAMERVGIEKRDILVDRVEEARDSQEEAQEQFASALEQYSALLHLTGAIYKTSTKP